MHVFKLVSHKLTCSCTAFHRAVRSIVHGMILKCSPCGWHLWHHLRKLDPDNCFLTALHVLLNTYCVIHESEPNRQGAGSERKGRKDEKNDKTGCQDWGWTWAPPSPWGCQVHSCQWVCVHYSIWCICCFWNLSDLFYKYFNVHLLPKKNIFT